MEPSKAIFSFNLGNIAIDIKPEAIVQLVIVLLILVLAWWSTRNMKIRPNKKQTIVESIYNMLNNIVISNVGESFISIVPFVGTLAVFIIAMNLTGLVGISPPTESFSVTLTLALISFVMVQGYAIKTNGVKKYFKGYLEPIPFIVPITILERIMLPVSLSLRLFGNMLAATFIVELVYESLEKVSWFAQLIIPIPLHLYFDIFDGGIQAVIFIMLTMINIKIVSDHN